jgi:hypothetical protein
MNPNVFFYALLSLMVGTFAAGVSAASTAPATPTASVAAATEQPTGDSHVQQYHFTMPDSTESTHAPAWAIQTR